MRLLWVLLMLCGVIVLGGFAVFGFLGLQFGDHVISLRPPFALFLLLGAGACAAGLFMRPGEFKEALRPDEPEVEPAAWIKEMRAQQNAKDE